MYVCMYVCVYVCMYVCIYIYIDDDMYIHIYIYMYIYTYIYVMHDVVISMNACRSFAWHGASARQQSISDTMSYILLLERH